MSTDISVIVDPAVISTAVTVATTAPVASVVLATGSPGPAGANGAQGPAGSDASVTSANITTALGYTPDAPTAPRTPTAHTHTKSQITDFPTLATVATSGAYADLTGLPTIPTTTDALTEGSTNLYFTAARAVSALASTLASYATQTWVTAQGYPTTSGVSSSISSAISALVTGVSSVAGKTGAVTLTKTDVGLGNVDNTSDANKPISTATQTALDGKSTTTHTHAYSTLTGLPTIPAAQVNSDWSASSGVAQILNKPTIPSATTDASLLTSGTLADARLSSNVVTLTGTQTLTNKSISSSQITGLSAVATTGSATDLTTGTLPLARLNSLVALDNQDNAFTVGQSINSGTITTSAPALNITQTWNGAGVVFTGLKANYTQTAASNSSLLIDLQLGGVSKFKVDVFGQVIAGSQASFVGSIYSAGLVLSNQTVLISDAANTLALRSGTSAQTSRIYGTYTDASNGRRLDITSTTGGIFTLTATGNGTGASGNLLKLTAPILIPASSVSLATNGDLAFEATSNTTLTIRYRGSDGTTRSVALTLA